MLQKLKERWGLLLLSLPLVGLGVSFLYLGVLLPLSDWTDMKNWEPVQAQIVSARMKRNYSEGSTTYRAESSYRYQYQGKSYSGDRVDISTGSSSDNDFEYHREILRPLVHAQENNMTVTGWVNPEQPEQAVLNRDLRSGHLLLAGVFALIFGALALGIWAYVLLARPDKTDVSEAQATLKPWLARRDWASATIKSDGKTGMWVLWVFAAFWNLISLPSAIGAVGEALDGNHVAWLALLFPLVGAVIIYWAVKLTLRWRRFGPAPLTLEPYPGAIGGQVGGTLEVTLPYHADNRFAVTLQCLHSYYSGSGKNRERHESMVWQSEGLAQTARTAYGTRVQWLFEVEDGLPVSEPPGKRYHLWRVNIKCELAGADFDRNYEIPVFATGEKSRQLAQVSASNQHPEVAQKREQLLESLFDIRQVPGGVVLHYPAFSSPSSKMVLIVMGAIFSGVGLLVDADGFPAWIFAVIGLPMFFGGLYALLSSLDVRIDRTELVTRRRLLGVGLGNKHTPRSEITKLFIDESYSSRTGNQHTTYYKIKAELRSGGCKTISHSLPGRELAQEALKSLCLLTGVPDA